MENKEENYVKVGPKGRHLEIPKGWRLLKSHEMIKINDKVANIYKAYWMPVEPTDVEFTAGEYDFVIRET